MLADEKPVAWNQRCGFKAKPIVPLYTHPATAAPQAEPETFESELRSFAETPEQVAFVEKLIAAQAEPKRPVIEVSLAAGNGYWGVGVCVGVMRFALAASFETLTGAYEYAEILRKALGITGDSDADQ